MEKEQVSWWLEPKQAAHNDAGHALERADRNLLVLLLNTLAEKRLQKRDKS
jgi:hypothetical protein